MRGWVRSCTCCKCQEARGEGRLSPTHATTRHTRGVCRCVSLLLTLFSLLSSSLLPPFSPLLEPRPKKCSCVRRFLRVCVRKLQESKMSLVSSEAGVRQIIRYSWTWLFVYTSIWKNMFLLSVACTCDCTFYSRGSS